MTINLASLLIEQVKLDTLINKNHKVTHENTKKERILALLVEIGELANNTRSFKYWSLKGPDAKEVILDEYADGLHFILSLSLVYKFKLGEVTITPVKFTKKELTEEFLRLYESIAIFMHTELESDFHHLIESFLTIGSALALTSEDICGGYMTKLVVNYERQKSNY